jgi:hypothetical protein
MISVVDVLEGLFRLHREADGDFGRPVENLEDVIAQQTAELAGGSLAAGELNAPIAGTAIRTDNVGLFHVANVRCASSVFA